MALQRIVVVPKPLEALPPMLDPAADDPESMAIARRLEVARGEHAETLAIVRRIVASDASVVWLETPSAEALEGAALAITVHLCSGGRASDLARATSPERRQALIRALPALLLLVALVTGSALTVAYTLRFLWGAFATKSQIPATDLVDRAAHAMSARIDVDGRIHYGCADAAATHDFRVDTRPARREK